MWQLLSFCSLYHTQQPSVQRPLTRNLPGLGIFKLQILTCLDATIALSHLPNRSTGTYLSTMLPPTPLDPPGSTPITSSSTIHDVTKLHSICKQFPLLETILIFFFTGFSCVLDLIIMNKGCSKYTQLN